MTTTLKRHPDPTLTTDDRVLLHAIAMAGDAVSTHEID